jgi:hypothetical protein
MPEIDHLAQSLMLLEEARQSEALANTAVDPAARANFQSMAVFWRQLAELRARLAVRGPVMKR